MMLAGQQRMLFGVLVPLVSLGLVPPGRVGPVRLPLRDHPLDRQVRLELGKVALVGAGPGDPELLTVAALRYISDPSALVVADRLVSSEVLDLVQGELRIAAKRPGCAEQAQAEIYRWVEEGVRENRTVIRLKIGDPFVFGRGGEEILHFREALGVEAAVVPGISAAIAAPLAAGVPITHRGAAHQVILTTGYGRNGSEPELPPWRPHQTYVILMGIGRLPNLVETLISNKDFPSDCPALVVERATCPDQRVVIGDMTDIADIASTHAIKAPSTIIFGASVRALYPDQPHGLVDQAIPDQSEHPQDIASLGDILSIAQPAPVADLTFRIHNSTSPLPTSV